MTQANGTAEFTPTPGYGVGARQPIFDSNVDRSRLSDDPVRSLWAAVVHQALTDAWWMHPAEGAWLPGQPQRQCLRAWNRCEALAWISGGLPPPRK